MSVTEWVGSTPPSWPLARIKHVCRTAGGGTPDKGKPQYWQGDIPWVSPKDMKSDRITDTEDHITTEGLSNSATQMVPPKSVLIVVRSGILRHSIPVAINEVPVSLNQDMRAFLPDERLAPHFLAWLIEGHQAELLQAWSKVGATVESLESDLIGDTLIPLPPRHEQEAIMAFLDRETARTGTLVAAKLRLLAVTRGLDPNVKLRNSGVPWLGGIPAHWKFLKFSWCVSITEGQVDPEDDEFSSWPLIAPNHIESGTGRLLGLESASEQGAISGKYKCHTGDVFYTKIRPALRKATLAPQACLCSADMYPMRVDGSRLISEYLLHYLLTDAFSVWAVLESNRVAMPKINRESLIELRMPVPPLDEQRAIVEHIARETAKLDTVRAATERTIALLKERRSALIAAVVAGQLDVGAAA